MSSEIQEENKILKSKKEELQLTILNGSLKDLVRSLREENAALLLEIERLQKQEQEQEQKQEQEQEHDESKRKRKQPSSCGDACRGEDVKRVRCTCNIGCPLCVTDKCESMRKLECSICRWEEREGV